jgi:hypothetical protein
MDQGLGRSHPNAAIIEGSLLCSQPTLVGTPLLSLFHSDHAGSGGSHISSGCMPCPVGRRRGFCRLVKAARSAPEGAALPSLLPLASATDGYGIPGIPLSSTKFDFSDLISDVVSTHPTALRCFLGRLPIRVSQGLVHLAGGPQSVQEHSELACNGDDGALFAVLAAALHQTFAVST